VSGVVRLFTYCATGTWFGANFYKYQSIADASFRELRLASLASNSKKGNPAARLQI
jgi:hypothetical protein